VHCYCDPPGDHLWRPSQVCCTKIMLPTFLAACHLSIIGGQLTSACQQANLHSANAVGETCVENRESDVAQHSNKQVCARDWTSQNVSDLQGGHHCLIPMCKRHSVDKRLRKGVKSFILDSKLVLFPIEVAESWQMTGSTPLLLTSSLTIAVLCNKLR
jgi:hypothetical protein